MALQKPQQRKDSADEHKQLRHELLRKIIENEKRRKAQARPK